jgi:hypothetical protein
MDLTQKMRNVIRAIVGLPEDPGQPPIIDRLAWYEAQVTACASDGSTCDVMPFDSRISPENGVKVLVGIPGSSSVVQPGPGALVMLGWERGDPSKPRCMPIWEAGATVNQLVLNALAMYLGGQFGALAAARKTDAVGAGATMAAWITNITAKFNAPAAPMASAPGSILPPTDFGVITGGSSVVNIK